MVTLLTPVALINEADRHVRASGKGGKKRRKKKKKDAPPKAFDASLLPLMPGSSPELMSF